MKYEVHYSYYTWMQFFRKFPDFRQFSLKFLDIGKFSPYKRIGKYTFPRHFQSLQEFLTTVTYISTWP